VARKLLRLLCWSGLTLAQWHGLCRVQDTEGVADLHLPEYLTAQPVEAGGHNDVIFSISLYVGVKLAYVAMLCVQADYKFSVTGQAEGRRCF
jgi:hypothetical protein